MTASRICLLIGLSFVMTVTGLFVVSCTREKPQAERGKEHGETHTSDKAPPEEDKQHCESKELVLSDFPKFFEKDVLIVVAENASQIELESSEEIAAKLEELTGSKPEVRNETKVAESDKKNYNLVLIGIPKSNSMLEEVYELTDAARVTEEYPGESKGILELLANPWSQDKAMLIVAGSDELGLKAGSKILRNVGELGKAKVVVDSEHLAENRQAVVLGLTPGQFEILDKTVREYLYENYPFLRDTKFGIRYEKVRTEVEGIPPGHLIIDAYANFRTPPVVVRLKLYNENVKILSQKVNKEDA